MSEELLEFAKISLDLFKKIISDNGELKEILDSKDYSLQTYYMGMVDDQERVNLYDGDIKVVDPEGKEFVKFKAKDYLSHLEEHVEPWTYVKFPYLKNIGWKGLVEGIDSGIYRVGPLARLNVSKGMATPLADKAYQEMYDLLGGKPLHSALALNWARVVEIVYIAERINELVKDKEITDKKVRTIPEGITGEGVGCVEAPRGTLFHHYIADQQGIAKKVNFVAPTTSNNGPICMSIRKAAQRVIKNFKVDDGLLNRIEVAFRAYDPCLACASHCLPGHMAMKVNIYNSDKKLINEIIRKEKVR
jgi:F420-non-reducing hydrogenase large subunit